MNIINLLTDEEIIIQPYDWRKCDFQEEFLIKIWAHTIINNVTEKVLLKIKNFKPFCKLELPSYYNENKFPWHLAYNQYFDWLKKSLNDDAPVGAEFFYSKKLYLYKLDDETMNEEVYPCLKLYFNTESALNHCTKFINKDAYIIPDITRKIPIKAKIWETNIDQIHKMITDTKLNYGKWLKCKYMSENEFDKISNLKYEYIVDYNHIIELSDDEMKNIISNPITLCLDIEAYSSNHLKMPEAVHAEDVITMISFIIQRLKPIPGEFGTKDGCKRILLVVGDCDEIENAEVIRFSEQMDMLKYIGNIFQQYNPSIVTGYNIYKFDLPYIDTKFLSYRSQWPNCSNIIDMYANTNVSTKNWKSGAYGFMNISKLDAEGTICIDLFPIIKRDHKLEKYTLDFVSKHFIKRGKHDVSAKYMFTIYEKLCLALDSKDQNLLNEIKKENAVVGKYCLEDSMLCIDLINSLNTYVSLIETSNVVKVTMMDIFTRGQQIRVQNQIYYYAYHSNYLIDERKISHPFAGGYVVQPTPGLYFNVLILDFASLYPSIIRAYNICYTTLVPENSTISDSKCNVLKWSETITEGKDKGTIKQFYIRFIKKEYKYGILPKMCEDLVNKRNNVREKIGPLNDEITNIILEETQKALKVAANSIFGALGVTDGFLPLPEAASFITAMGRDLNHQCQDYVKNNTENGKIVYGDTDSIMVDLSIKDLNECKDIGYKLSHDISKNFIKPLSLEFERALAVGFFIKKKMYAGLKATFIDKDSKYSKVNKIEKISYKPEYKTDLYDLYKINWIDRKNKNKEVTTYLQINKNSDLINYSHYSGIEVEESGSPNSKSILKKGIVNARRDRCLWVRKAYQKILNSILYSRDLKHCLSIIDDEIIKAMSSYTIYKDEKEKKKLDGIDFSDFVCTREVNSYKQTSNCPMKIFKEEQLKKGKALNDGERVDYIFVKQENVDKEKNKQGYKMRLIEDYWENYSDEPIDKMIYIEKQFLKPVEQIIYLAYKEELDYYENTYSYLATGKKKNPKIIPTYPCSKYIQNWISMLKLKQLVLSHLKLIHQIKSYHVSRQSFIIVV